MPNWASIGTPEEQSREYNSKFLKGVKYAISRTDLGMAFFTPGENLVYNQDRTITWTSDLSACLTKVEDGRAAAHAFLEITTGEKEKKSIVFVFCSNNESTWRRLKETIDTMGPGGSVEATLAASALSPAITMHTLPHVARMAASTKH